jgi:chlorite dismutase
LITKIANIEQFYISFEAEGSVNLDFEKIEMLFNRSFLKNIESAPVLCPGNAKLQCFYYLKKDMPHTVDNLEKVNRYIMSYPFYKFLDWKSLDKSTSISFVLKKNLWGHLKVHQV